MFKEPKDMLLAIEDIQKLLLSDTRNLTLSKGGQLCISIPTAIEYLKNYLRGYVVIDAEKMLDWMDFIDRMKSKYPEDEFCGGYISTVARLLNDMVKSPRRMPCK